MAKLNTTPAGTTATATEPRAMPRIGETVQVQARTGVKLLNNETGGYIADDKPTPQTVTVTLLRRLADGDLVLA
jgi:hypothetical protein